MQDVLKVSSALPKRAHPALVPCATGCSDSKVSACAFSLPIGVSACAFSLPIGVSACAFSLPIGVSACAFSLAIGAICNHNDRPEPARPVGV